MKSKTALITGANSGLGLACARALVDRGDWHVVLAVRDTERGDEAARELDAPADTTVMELDLASPDSVRSFAGQYRGHGLPPTRALICNAGIQVPAGLRLSAEGMEITFATNHLGHFALVKELLGQLDAPARIVIVSSDTHDPKKHTGMPSPRYSSAQALAHPDVSAAPASGRERYTTSKLCNVLFAYELDRRLRADGRSGVTVNAFNPGLMPGSGLAREYGAFQRLAWRFVMPMMRVLPSVRSTGQSGRHLAALAADPVYDVVSGSYFDGLKRTKSSVDSYDRAMAQDLWETSERLLSPSAA